MKFLGLTCWKLLGEDVKGKMFRSQVEIGRGKFPERVMESEGLSRLFQGPVSVEDEEDSVVSAESVREVVGRIRELEEEKELDG